MEIRTTRCCGIREIDGIQDYSENEEGAKELLIDAIPRLTGELDGAFAFFSCNDESEMGAELMSFIEENDLGSVQQTRTVLNINSGNNLTMYIWTLNLDNMRNWHAEATTPPEQVVNGLGGVQIAVGAEVQHTAYGVGVCRALREGHVATVGVQFIRTRDGQHNLDGAINSETGMWVNPERVRVIPTMVTDL